MADKIILLVEDNPDEREAGHFARCIRTRSAMKSLWPTIVSRPSIIFWGVGGRWREQFESTAKSCVARFKVAQTGRS